MNFRLVETPPERFRAKALATIAKGDACRFDAGGLDQAGDGEQVDAFALENITSAEMGWFGRGIMEVIGQAETSTNFAPGDQVYLASGQQLDAGSSGNVSMGIVLEDPELGGLVRVRFDPEYTFIKA